MEQYIAHCRKGKVTLGKQRINSSLIVRFLQLHSGEIPLAFLANLEASFKLNIGFWTYGIGTVCDCDSTPGAHPSANNIVKNIQNSATDSNIMTDTNVSHQVRRGKPREEGEGAMRWGSALQVASALSVPLALTRNISNRKLATLVLLIR